MADDTARICMIETRTVNIGSPVTSPANDARYQYSNHLGTVSLELDAAANTISYEEYHPYGTSAYRAVDSAIEVSAKRYRYTGLERDEETGLDLMGARYYASWLGRWTAADPIGLGDGPNRYAYVRGNPVGMRDPSGTKVAPGFEHLTIRVTTGRGSGGKGATLLESEGTDPGPPTAERAAAEKAAAEKQARTARRAARRAARENEILETTVDMAVAQYEEVLRSEDAHRLEQLDALAERTGGLYFGGRAESYFARGPSGEGPRRVADLRDDLRSTLRRTKGQPFDKRVAALEKVSAKALAGAGWRGDAAADIALFEAGASFGAAVAGRGQGAWRSLNLGAGSNPMKGAVNVDLKAGPGVVHADATALPFESGTFSEVHAINPYGFNPVSPETARVLQSGGLLRVTGTSGNKFAKPVPAGTAQAAGFEFVETTPLQDVHQFGVQRTTAGEQLKTSTSKTTVYRKKP